MERTSNSGLCVAYHVQPGESSRFTVGEWSGLGVEGVCPPSPRPGPLGVRVAWPAPRTTPWRPQQPA